MEHVVGPCDRLALLSVGFVDLSVFREAEGVFLRAFVSALAIYKKIHVIKDVTVTHRLRRLSVVYQEVFTFTSLSLLS